MTTKDIYFYAIGRRKGAVAQIKLFQSKGNITINKKPIEEVFPSKESIDYIKYPLELTKKMNKNAIEIKVSGGGISGQSGAIRLGISRALVKSDSSYRSILKNEGLLTRDSRIKESKKYGLVKARKAKQFSKR